MFDDINNERVKSIDNVPLKDFLQNQIYRLKLKLYSYKHAGILPPSPQWTGIPGLLYTLIYFAYNSQHSTIENEHLNY